MSRVNIYAWKYQIAQWRASSANTLFSRFVANVIFIQLCVTCYFQHSLTDL
jgi:hypothetical protein